MNDKNKKHSLTEKIKEGVSVHEIETIARKYTSEAFCILALIIAIVSASLGFFSGAGWSIVFGGISAIISISFPEVTLKTETLYFKFLTKQEKIAQIAIGVVQIILALFVPFIIFAQVGLLSGIAFHHFSHHPKMVEDQLNKSAKTDNEKEHL